MSELGLDPSLLGETGTFFIASIAAVGWVTKQTITAMRSRNGNGKSKSGNGNGKAAACPMADPKVAQALIDLSAAQTEQTLAMQSLVKLSEESVVLLRKGDEHRIREEEARHHEAEWQNRVEQALRAN
tara:strand:- start:1010 stop:1393 length:384 start_codon:yes stop_codon:yes gene_type:complete